jgi:hypothetical protein
MGRDGLPSRREACPRTDVTTIRINRFRVETLGRVFGTKAFVSALDDAIPLAYERALNALKVWAEETELDYAEYANEHRMLEEWYGWWAPRLAGYSALVAIHSLVETELFACGDRMADHQARGKRRGLERAASYLNRVAGVDVRTDEAWAHLLRMEDLRHIVVHRGGSVERSEDDRKTVSRLQRHYRGQLWITRRTELHDAHVHVVPTLATEFATFAEEFFRRVMSRLDM